MILYNSYNDRLYLTDNLKELSLSLFKWNNSAIKTRHLSANVPSLSLLMHWVISSDTVNRFSLPHSISLVYQTVCESMLCTAANSR